MINFLIEWFARHRIAANLLVVATIIGGLLAARAIPREIIPDIEPQNITVTSTLPGASPAITETSLCIPIENALRPLANIRHIHASALANQCVLSIEIADASAQQTTIAAINTALALLPLPAQASRPLIGNPHREVMAIRLGVYGIAEYDVLRRSAEQTVSELKALGIDKVKVIEARTQQITVKVAQTQLQRYQISMAEIAAALRQKGLNLPAGHIASASGLATVVITDNYRTRAELAASVIRALPDGSQLRLGDIATLHDEYSSLEARINGLPSVAIAIYQGKNTDIAELSASVQQYLATAQARLPDNVKLISVFDNARFFDARMDYLTGNFFDGLLISSLILLLWLRLRLAFWITADIPIAFAGGIIWLYLMGGSINMVSAFGLIVVLGIVCDDAIVIGENIYRHQCHGQPGLEGAIVGTREVANTVIFAVSTTVLMFVPLLFLPGSEGQLMRPLPMIIIAILLASLIEALLVLPTHLAHYKQQRPTRQGFAVAEKMDTLALTIYRPLLARAIQWRYAVLVACMSVFIICISLIASGTVSINFFSAVQTEVASGVVSFADPSDSGKTRAAVRRMEQAALALQQELHQEFGSAQIELVRTFVASQSTHGEVYLSLARSGQRQADSADILQRWQEKTGTISGAASLAFSSTVKLDSATFSTVLHAADASALAQASAALRQHLQQYAGVSHSRDSLSQTRQEIRLALKPAATALGLTVQNLSAQLHMALEGTQLPELDGKTVVLKLADATSGINNTLASLPIQISPLQSVPLGSVASIETANTAAAIMRIDGQRMASVSADIDPAIIRLPALQKRVERDFLQHLHRDFPGVGWSKAGAMEAEQRIKDYLGWSFALSLLAMFVMLAAFLNSYFQPLMIFSAIPFGIVGALAGHLVFGHELTLWSAAGMIAVSGIVVNNNMVIIFFINERGKAGHSLAETVMLAGADRFRPVMLTTLTTFVGVLPTIVSNSWETQFLVPLAISIGCGVLFAATLTLILVPCLYMIGNDLKAALQRKTSRLPAEM